MRKQEAQAPMTIQHEFVALELALQVDKRRPAPLDAAISDGARDQ
jgi:hypothetical protein